MRKKKFNWNREFEKNLRGAFMFFGIILVFLAGFYTNAVSNEIDLVCHKCFNDPYCSDNDMVCGDFGVYYFKLATLIAMGCFGAVIAFVGSSALIKEVSRNGS